MENLLVFDPRDYCYHATVAGRHLIVDSTEIFEDEETRIAESGGLLDLQAAHEESVSDVLTWAALADDPSNTLVRWADDAAKV